MPNLALAFFAQVATKQQQPTIRRIPTVAPRSRSSNSQRQPPPHNNSRRATTRPTALFTASSSTPLRPRAAATSLAAPGRPHRSNISSSSASAAISPVPLPPTTYRRAAAPAHSIVRRRRTRPLPELVGATACAATRWRTRLALPATGACSHFMWIFAAQREDQQHLRFTKSITVHIALQGSSCKVCP